MLKKMLAIGLTIALLLSTMVIGASAANGNGVSEDSIAGEMEANYDTVVYNGANARYPDKGGNDNAGLRGYAKASQVFGGIGRGGSEGAMRLTFLTPTPDKDAYVGYRLFDQSRVISGMDMNKGYAGEWYKVSFWYKVEQPAPESDVGRLAAEGTPVNMTLDVLYGSCNWSHAWYANTPEIVECSVAVDVSEESDWQRYSTAFKVTAVQGFHVALAAPDTDSAQGASVLIDDMSIEKIDDPGLEPGEGPTGTLMDFEDSSDMSEYTYNTNRPYVISEEKNHTEGGVHSLKTTIAGGWHSQRGRPRIVLKDELGNNFKLVAEREYTVSFWIYTDMKNAGITFWLSAMSDLSRITVESGDVHQLQNVKIAADMGALNATKNEVEYAALPSGAWHRLTVTVPSATLQDASKENYLAFGFTLIGCASSDWEATDVYIDDITINEKKEEVGEPDIPDIPIRPGVANGYFEGVSHVSAYVTNRYRPFTFSSEQNHTPGGELSLKVTIQQRWNSQRGRPRIVIPAMDGNLLKVEEGKTYHVSFWLYTDRPNTAVTYWLAVMNDLDAISVESGDVHLLQNIALDEGMGTLNDAGNEVETVALNTGEWRKLSATIPAAMLQGDGDNYLAMGFTIPECHNDGFVSTDVYLDDLMVTVDGEQEPDMPAATSGTCGENMQWRFDESTGKLVITGIGAMETYSYLNLAPWYAHSESITAVELPEGMTSIGAYAFFGCDALEQVTIPTTVQSIAAHAFQSCAALQKAVVSVAVQEIGLYAFDDCPQLTLCGVPGSVAEQYAAANEIPFERIATASIDIATPPIKTVYVLGEKLDTTGLRLTVSFVGGGTVEATDGYIASADLSVVGWRTVSVTYGNVTVTYNVMVKPVAPAAPTVVNKTDSMVILAATVGHEYKMDDGMWQPGNVFVGLTAGRTYSFYQRVAETATAYASSSSEALVVEIEPQTVNQWLQDAGGWYYVDGNGRRVTNAWMMDSVGWCYLGADGYCITNAWVADSIGWCYLDAEGRMATNAWVMDSVGWCYVGADGYCITNAWMADSIGWCYLDAEGRMAVNQWIMDSVGWCYVGADGYCITNAWMADSVGWCYLDAEGRMVTNAWVMDSVGWCYLGADGYCITNAWVADSIGWCYLDAEGRMVTNAWVMDSVGWCYIGVDGYCITNAWMADSVGWCYLDAEGRMIVGRTAFVDGGWYTFDENGYWVV